jgi:hypothetical protein
VRAQIHPLSDDEQHGGTVERIISLETGKTFGTNNREQEKPNLEWEAVRGGSDRHR